MRSMRSVEIVEVFPLRQLPLQIDVVRVTEELVELFAIGAMGPFHLAVQLRRARLDIHMPNPLVLHVPMKQGLELMSPVRPDGVDPEGELRQHVIYEADGIGLVVARVDLECSYPRGIVYGFALEATNSLAVRSLEREHLDVHLNVMTRNFFRIAARVQRPATGSRG